MSGNEERKKQVVIGNLPGDFLRFDGQVEGTSNAVSQMELDEQTARSLHRELNAPALGAQIPAAQYYAAGGGGFIPPNSKGRLSICLVQARLTKNYGFVKMDPYCRVRVGTTVFETPTDAGGGKNPHWNRTVYCYLPQGIETIYLEIFDEKAFTTDERVAWNSIAIPAAVFNGDTIDDWYSLSGQQGDAKEGMINIVFTLYPITAPHVAYVPVAQTTPQAGFLPGVAQPDAAIASRHSRQEPPYTDRDIKEMQEMFTNMDVEVIKSVMYEKGGNKDAAVNALLTIGSDESVQVSKNAGDSASGGTQSDLGQSNPSSDTKGS